MKYTPFCGVIDGLFFTKPLIYLVFNDYFLLFMAKSITPLRDTQIAKAKPKDKLYRLYDGNGLHLAVSTKGTKTWYFCYTHPITGKKNQSHKLGRYPTMSLLDARTHAQDCQKQLTQGIDPKAYALKEQAKAQNKILLADFANTYLDYIATFSKPRTINSERQRLSKDIIPALGQLTLDGISKAHVEAMADKIEARTKKDGSPPRETTRRTIAIVCRLLKFAKVKGLVETVVCDDLLDNYPKLQGGHFKFVAINDLPRLLNDINAYHGDIQTKLGMKFLAYTFCRTGEMRFLKWQHIDWVEQVWQVDIDTLKRRASHKVPLSTQVLDILKQLQPITGDDEYVFFNKSKLQPYSENFINNALRIMGYRGEQSGHGFRHIASTNLNELGYQGDAIEKQMHHKGNNTIRAIYNHAEHMEERREIMQAWANFLDMLAQGERVSFRQARAMLDKKQHQAKQHAIIDKLKARGLDDDDIQALMTDWVSLMT